MRHLHPLPLRRLGALVATTVATTALTAALAPSVTGGAATAAPADRAATPVKIRPDKIARGADVSVAHIEGSTLVDGAVRIDIGSAQPDLLGRAGADYLVQARDDQGVGPVLRITPAGVRTTVVVPARKGDLPVASTDGSLVAQAVPQKGFSKTKLRVWSTSGGALVASKAYPGLAQVLDLDAKRVVVAGSSDTTSWTMSSGLVRKVVARGGYLADIANDRLASFTGDPYDGGCTVVSSLSKPGTALWRSCDVRVEAFAPGGRRAATVDLLADGIGPSVVFVLGNRGKRVSTYGIRGYFGPLTWETKTALLLPSYGRTQSAVVRCTGATCERASDLAPTPALRPRS